MEGWFSVMMMMSVKAALVYNKKTATPKPRRKNKTK